VDKVESLLAHLPARFRPTQLADALGCSLPAVHYWIRKGILPQPVRVGTNVLVFLKSEVVEALARRQEVAGAP